ncbi:MAG: PD-(D/E)XK nuclease family protein [Pseudohongiellaceae bacterium]
MQGSRVDISGLTESLARGDTILVPNNRLCDAILHRFAQDREESVFVTPPVFAIDIWIKRLWEQAAALGVAPCMDKAILSSIEEQYLWVQLIEESLDTYPLLNPEETARAVSQAWQTMKLWQLDQPDSSALAAFSGIPDVAAFLRWADAFAARCAATGVVSLVGATALLGELSEDVFASLLPASIVLVNFYEPPPLYRALFSRLSSSREVQTIAREGAVTARATARLTLPDPRSEESACADWIARMLAQEPNAHIGVICNNRQERQAPFTRALADALHPDSLFDFGSDGELFNSAGAHSSLLQAGLIHDALLVLGLVQELQLSDDLCRLLQSPYILPGEDDEQESRLAMERLMRRRFLKRCTLEEFGFFLGQQQRDCHSPALASALLAVRTRLRRMGRQASALAWRECFEAMLVLLGWPGPALTRHERRLFEQWQKTLDQFGAAGVTLGRLDGATALARLRQLCQQTPQWRESGLRRQVSFYSANEAIGLRFDHLWLLGCDDQSWPRAVNTSPFLPYALQKEAGVPGSHSDLQYLAARGEFDLLCRSVSGELLASHFAEDGDQTYRASSFILDFPVRSQTTASQTSASEPGINRYALSRHGACRLEEVPDTAAVVLPASADSRGGHSVLGDQSACPFRAFARHRLQAEALEDFRAGLDQRQRGSAIHIALEYLFSRLPDRTALAALVGPARQALCEQAASAAVDYLLSQQRRLMTPRFRAIEHRRLTALLQAFLDAEERRADFEIIAREQALTWTHAALSLRLKIDRIDRLGDGRLAVIDYKSGKRTPALHSWVESRPEDMQLPVYSVAADELSRGEVSAIGLAHLNVTNTGYSMLVADENFHPDIRPVQELKRIDRSWPELRELFSDSVTRMADEFIRGILRVDPAHGQRTCQYCRLQPLCRVDELISDADSATVDEDSSYGEEA